MFQRAPEESRAKRLGKRAGKKLAAKLMSKWKGLSVFYKVFIIKWVLIAIAVLVIIALIVFVIIGIQSSLGQGACGGISATTNATDEQFTDPEQLNNAATIIATANERGLGRQGALVGLVTAMQESTLKNLNHGDRDSLGVFQQRPSQGWGTPEQVTDVKYAAGKFFDGLQKVGGWETMAPTVAAQTVQRSAFPDAYAKWEAAANRLIDKINPNIQQTPGGGAGGSGCPAGVGATVVGGLARPINNYTLTSDFGMRGGEPHQGLDLGCKIGEPVYAAMGGTVTRAGSANGYGKAVYVDSPGGIQIQYGHISEWLVENVEKGEIGAQTVQPGQEIAKCGSEGVSTGPHLHFEININGQAIDPKPMFAEKQLPFAPKGQPFSAPPAPPAGAPAAPAAPAAPLDRRA